MTRDGAKQASADTEIFEEDKDQLSRPRQRRPHRQRVGASSRRTVSTPPPRPPSPPSRHRLSKPEPTPEGHLLQGEVGPIPAAKTMNGVARGAGTLRLHFLLCQLRSQQRTPSSCPCAEIFPARLRSTCHGISAKVGAILFLYAAQGPEPGYSPRIGIRNTLFVLAGTNFLDAARARVQWLVARRRGGRLISVFVRDKYDKRTV
jgi:hypothetical protein